MQTQFLNPPTLCSTFGWTHVVTATAGKTVYVSGQISVTERDEVVGTAQEQLPGNAPATFTVQSFKATNGETLRYSLFVPMVVYEPKS